MGCIVEVGMIGTNKSGMIFEVTSQVDVRHYAVKFLDSGYETIARKDYITTRTISDPNTVTKYGQGYIGAGPYRTITDEFLANGKNKASEAYTRWNGMMQRCYSLSFREYPRYGAVGYHVGEDWKCFQNYAEFFYAGWEQGLVLDKDILDPENKTYCAEKCKFVPVYINNLLIHSKNVTNGLPVGVYYLKKGPNMVSELKKPYMVEWQKKSLGRFSDPMEAHKVWQINKANHIEATVGKYATEKWFDSEVADALISRVWKLRLDAQLGIETVRL